MKSRSIFKKRWFWISLAIVAYLLAFATDLIPCLRGPSVPQWRWLYDFDPAVERLWPAGVVLTLALIFLAFVSRLQPKRIIRRQEAIFLIALILLALCGQLAVLFVEQENVAALLFDRIVSPTANGYFSVAVTIRDASAVLRDFPAQMIAFPYQHPSTHPPGILLLYVAVLRVVGNMPALAEPLGMWARTWRCADVGLMALSNAQLAGAVLLGFLGPLLSTLTLLPLYGIGRRLYGVKGALRGGLLYTLVPAVSLFAAEMDQTYPFFACLTLYWLMLAIEERRWGYALLAGLAISAATFMSVVNVMLLALPLIYFALQIVFAQARHRISWRYLLFCIALFFVGLFSIWIVYRLFFGVSLFDILDAATHDLQIPPLPDSPTLFDRLDQISVRLRKVNGGRSYLIWLFYNLYDFLTFLGLALSTLLIISVARAVRRLRERRLTAAEILPSAFILTLLLLNLSGVIRGEVGRIWLFLMPFGALAAAGAPPSEKLLPFWPVAGLQLAQAVVFAMSLTVVDTVLWPMPVHERSFTPLSAQYPLDLEFGETIRLLGYDLDDSPVSPGDSVNLTLHWQSVAQTPISYKVFIHLLDAGGQIRGQQDSTPLNGDWPTTCWARGEVITDRYTLTLPSDAPTGEYTLAVGFYHETTGERLPVDGDDHVRLGPVTVSTSP